MFVFYCDVMSFIAEKPSALKLVLKVGPLTPSDVTTDSQSETQDSDTAMSEKKSKVHKKSSQNDLSEVVEKKVSLVQNVPFEVY